MSPLWRESGSTLLHSGSAGFRTQGSGGPRELAAVPVWAPAAAAEPGLSPNFGVEAPAVADSPASEASRLSRRPRSGLVVALFVFYCLQLAAAAVAWREAPIRTDALSDAMVAYAVCAVLVLPAFVLRGRWRILPTLLATAVGTAVPILLARDLMEVVGPRDVWVGQSLTLQVLFPLVVGFSAMIALLTAPGRVP